MALAFSRNISTGGQLSVLLLAELQAAHTKLLQAMALLDELTRGPLPPKGRVVDARWNISRASLARRTLWSRVLTHLSSGTLNETASDLRRLQESDMALLRASSAHVTKWNIETVMRDWTEYCSASRDIRWKMKAAIGAEKRLLYPMLGA